MLIKRKKMIQKTNSTSLQCTTWSKKIYVLITIVHFFVLSSTIFFVHILHRILEKLGPLRGRKQIHKNRLWVTTTLATCYMCSLVQNGPVSRRPQHNHHTLTTAIKIMMLIPTGLGPLCTHILELHN